MKKTVFFAIALVAFSCKQTETESSVAAVRYESFGRAITADSAWNATQMLARYKAMKPGDTAVVKFASDIHEVCKKKGCWMSLRMPDSAEAFVRFKDYSFFVPKNADGSKAVVHGKAFFDVTPVAELKHYAKDGGKPQAEIDKITEPEIRYAFEADGVLIAK